MYQSYSRALFSNNAVKAWLQWLLLGGLSLWMLVAEARKEASLEPGLINPGHHEQPAWFKNSFLDLREDVAEAAEEDKRVILYFYQDGCPYCARLLQDNFANRQIADKTRQHFQVIAINLWGDREVTDLQGAVTTEKQFARALNVQYTPTLLFLDEQGKTVARLNGYYAPHQFAVVLDYVAGKHESKQSLRDYYAQNKGQAASGQLHAEPFFLPPPLDLQQTLKSGRPLLVLFEQKTCAACDELHRDIFSRESVILALSNFDVAQVDMWATTALITPQGERTSARAWAARLGVQYAPSFVFFDAQGQEVFRAEAWLKTFHLLSVLDYVATGAYRYQPNFQRFVQRRADALHAKGLAVDLLD